jgi:hypothetical protein
MHVAIDVDANVREQGADETVGDDADHSLDRFIRAHKLRRPAALQRELFQETHVHI